jgi:hypothetical protein
VIVAKAWRATDAAKKQALLGIITWATYRQLCAEVDRFKRARLNEARDAARVPQVDITKSSGEISSDRPTRGWKYQPADFKRCQVPMPGGRVCGWTTRRTVAFRQVELEGRTTYVKQVYSACPGHDRRDAETFTPAQIAARMSQRHENHREPRRAATAYSRSQRAQAQRLVAAGWDADTYREWLTGQQSPSRAA